MPDPNDLYVPFDPPKVAPKSTLDHIYDTVAAIPRVAGMGIRLGSGALAGEGMIPGALIAGGGEMLAELIENGLDPRKINPSRVGIEAGLGAIPLGSIASKGKMALSAVKGAGLAAAGVEGRKWSEGQGITNPLKDWDKWDAANVAIGGGLGAFGGRDGAEGPNSINPDKYGPTPEAGPVAPPRPDITKPKGLRVFNGYDEKGVYTAKPIEPTIQEQEALRKALDKEGPKGPLHTAIEEKVNLEKSHDEANKLVNNEAASDVQAQIASQADKKANAGEVVKAAKADQRIADKDITQEARNQNARQKFLAQSQAQMAKNMNAAEKTRTKMANDAEAQRIIDDARKTAEDAGMTQQTSAPTERTSIKNGPTSESVTTRYVNPPEPEAPPAAPAPAGPPPIIAPGASRTIYPTKKQAIFEAKQNGAIDVVKDPTTGKGWVHVMPGEAKAGRPGDVPIPDEMLPEATPTAAVPETVPEAATPEVTPKVAVGTGPGPRTLLPNQEQGIKDLEELQARIHGDDPPTVGNGTAPVEPAPDTPNLIRSAPSDDINDLDLATGVTTTKPVKALAGPKGKTISYATAEEAGAAAKAAGLPETSIEQVKNGTFRVTPTKPHFAVALGSEGGIASPEGVVMNNTKGNWERTEFKGASQPEAPPIAPKGKGLRVAKGKSPKAEVPAEVAPAQEPAIPVATPSAAQKFRDKAAAILAKVGERAKSEEGSVDPEFGYAVASHAVPALIGAGVGGSLDEEHPMRGALIGGAAGLASPHVLNALKGMEIPHVSMDSIGEKLGKAGAMLPNIQRANLLSDPLSLGINAFLAPMGSTTLGGIEHGLTGMLEKDPDKVDAAGNILKNVVPNFFSKRRWDTALTEAGERIGQNERGEVMTGEADTKFGKALAVPGTIMTAGDMIGRDTQMNAGVSEPLARRYTVTGEPRSATAEKFVNFGRTGSINRDDEVNRGTATLAKLMLPFSRTAANVVEGSLERTPLLGYFVQWTHDPQLRDSLAAQTAQQGLGAGVGFAAYELGKRVDPDTAKQYRVQKAISNMAGQYGSIAAIAFAAGQAEQTGVSKEGKVIATASQDVPLPTVQGPVDTVKSVWNLIHGEPAHPDAAHLPQKYLPNMLVPGFLRDNTLDQAEEALYTPFEKP